MAIYIGVDSGTQSTKAVALDLERGSIVAEARAPHRLIAGLPPGHMEQHPEEWESALNRVLGQVAKRIDGRRVRGIGVSGQQHGFVPLDAKGAVIRPAKLWCDTSTIAECDALTKKLGGPHAVLRKTGMPFLPGYTAPKILWLKRHEPRNYRRLRRVLLPHDYLNFRLTGGFGMEFGDASGTALMDVRRREWSRDAINAIDPHLAQFLPELRASQVAAGTLRPTLARRFGFGTDVVISAGGGDNMMGAIGTGNVAPGTVTASLGTSGTIYAYSAQPVVDPQGEIAAFCSSTGGWLPLLCTMNVTLVTEHLKNLFSLDHAAFEKAASRVPVGSGGLLLLPYLDGERTPNLPRATGVLQGITRRNLDAPHLARAAIEGVTLGLNYGLRRLRTLGVKPTEIRLTGGGSKSALWRQIAADVFGVPVVCMKLEESAAVGAALQAAWTAGSHNGSPRALGGLCRRFATVDRRTCCRPDRRRHGQYRQLQEKHDLLATTLRDFFE